MTVPMVLLWTTGVFGLGFAVGALAHSIRQGPAELPDDIKTLQIQTATLIDCMERVTKILEQLWSEERK